MGNMLTNILLIQPDLLQSATLAALVVLINDPKGREYYGGVVSAPVFSNIMSYALKANNIPPDSSNYTKTVRRTVYLNSQENKAKAN